MDKKLKTIIVIDSMGVGGIPTSLYNFINHTTELLDCDLFSFDPDSVDKDRLPKNVRVLDHEKWLQMLGISQKDFLKKAPFYGVCRMGLVLCSRLISGQFARKLLFATVKKVAGYDLAISFAQDNGWKSLTTGCIDFVVSKVDAPYKAAYIHCDYANYGGYDPRQEQMLSKMDAIACVSDSCVKQFVSMFPNLKSKCIACENFTDVNAIIKKAEPAVVYPNDSVNFVTVCRLGEEKGLARTVEAFAELRQEGYEQFTWTIVGGGPEEKMLVELIKANDLTGKISLAGEQKNPYPYIKNASVFLLPSFHEAAPMVFGESIAVEVPILTTNTCSAEELVQNRKCGFVVDNSKEGIKSGIRRILENPAALKEVVISKDKINARAWEQVKLLVSQAGNSASTVKTEEK